MIKLQYPFIHQAFVYIQNNLTNHFTKNQHAVCYKAFCDLILDAVSVIKKMCSTSKLFLCVNLDMGYMSCHRMLSWQ